VVQHLNAGRRPVALLAQDRIVIRRVRALLARQSVPVHDETGWTLATTPAAAAVMALLRAALSGGAVDDWLAWMKSALAAGWDGEGLTGLESRCRRFGAPAVRAHGG
ncbi:MAG: PD-(D/E)XK nuclease family protein, partial [Rubrivivax sp.]